MFSLFYQRSCEPMPFGPSFYFMPVSADSPILLEMPKFFPEPALGRIPSVVVTIVVIVKSILRPAVFSIVQVPLTTGTPFSIVNFHPV